MLLLKQRGSHSSGLEPCYLNCAAALLHELVMYAKEGADIQLEFFERSKGDDGSVHIQKMIDLLKEANGTVGALPKVYRVCMLSRSHSTLCQRNPC